MKAPRRQRGFTLLEVLVAFVVMALVLGALMQVFSTSLGNLSDTGRYTLAALHAEALLAETGTEAPLGAGIERGRFDDVYSWERRVEAHQESDWPPPDPGVSLYHVVVEVSWAEGSGQRSVELESWRAVLPE